ncbi:MAG: ABC transporter ATP-binding protein [Chloroflexota bacterium]|jgi:ABC-type multidrug transport system fused ATPase/permease subunit|nr:ABC transporter ATP-binding protein [Chloroflexota bacterium]MDP6757801.1 ABC transporter ATP-binding protein [Chloroflexota bacterium]
MRSRVYVDISNLSEPGVALGTARRLLAYLRDHRLSLAGAMFSMVLVASLNLVAPWVTKIVIDDHVVDGDFGAVAVSLLALLGIYGLRALTMMATIILVQRSGQIVIYGLTRDLYRHLLRLPMLYFEREATGETLSRLTADVNAVQRATMGPTLGALVGLLTMFVYVAVLFALEWRLTLLILSVVPPMILLSAYSARELRKRYRTVQETLAEMNTTIEENLKGIRVSRAFAREGDEMQRFSRDNTSNLRANMDTATVESISTPSIQALSSLSIGAIILYGGWQITDGTLTTGTLVAFLAFVTLFHRPLTEIIQVNYVMQSALAAADRIFQFMDEPRDQTDRPDMERLEEFGGRVEFRDVDFAYEPDKPVLRGVNLTAERGEVIALVGPTGAGKTTIVNLLGRYYDPDAGGIFLDGRDAHNFRSSSIREQMAFVLQETYLFSDTIGGNIRYGMPEATDEEVRRAAEQANATEFVDELPDGFEAVVGGGGVQLSRGQVQRISLARALLADPVVLVLDEATSDVDTETEALIQQAMDAAMAGRTVFVIAHRLSTIRRADQILVVDDGRIQERGTHDELLVSGGVYRQLHESQFAGLESAGQGPV